MSTVVVATPDVVGARMAGPGIRAWNLARQIARVAPTTLIAKLETPPRADVTMIDRGSAEAAIVLKSAKVLVGQPARGFRKRRRDQKIVYDLFDPTVLELRELYGGSPSMRQRVHAAAPDDEIRLRLRAARDLGGIDAEGDFDPRRVAALQRFVETSLLGRRGHQKVGGHESLGQAPPFGGGVNALSHRW